MSDEALLNKLISVAGQNNEMDCREELAAYKAEMARRLSEAKKP
tara:strand:+ start:6761 stop:6892 length:132 start_codon:yes stop_codon:yes gene_type:complete